MNTATSTWSIALNHHKVRISEGARGFIQRIMELDPEQRPTAKGVLNDEWLKSFIE